jgi:hypothetical protein
MSCYVRFCVCFRNVLKTPDGRDMWVLPDQKTGFYDLELQLPDGVKCEQCILQVIFDSIQCTRRIK